MPVPSMIRLVRAATMLSVVSASRNGNGRRAPRNRWSQAQTDAKPSSSAVIAYAHTASMSGTFVSGVKFSRAKPNSTGMASLQAGWAAPGSSGRPASPESYARAAGRFIGGSCQQP